MLKVVFIFELKTAYDMRMSDWSADVCSSYLAPTGLESRSASRHAGPVETSPFNARDHGPTFWTTNNMACAPASSGPGRSVATFRRTTNNRDLEAMSADRGAAGGEHGRSAEHMSELQSLMRTSYAVFSLQKKNNKH